MRIKDVVNLCNVKTDDHSKPYVALENIESWNSKFIPSESVSEGMNNVFDAGDILFGKLRPYLAKAYIPNFDGICSTEFFVLKPKKGFDSRYLLYRLLMPSFIWYINSRVTGVKMPRTNWNDFSNVEIDIPSLPVQRRIVSYLDSKTSEIDHAISLLEQKREAYTQLKASVINRAVTRGLNPNVKLKDSGVEWIGKIPEGWKVKRLKNITLLNPICKTHMHGVVSFVPMESLRNDNIDLQTIKFEEGINKYTFFSNDDLLIAKVTPCFENGNIAIAQNLQQGIGFGSSEIYVLRAIKGEVCNRYLFYLCESSSFRDEACATMHGVGGLKRISPLFMQTCEIALPPLTEQRSIASYLDSECSKIDRAASIVEKQIDAYKRLKRSLINEVVTGKRKVE